MKKTPETNLIHLNHLMEITHGDEEVTKRYLLQFQELMPTRIENLRESLKSENRKLTRQILHQMSPQIQFFGIPDVVPVIKKLEFEYANMPFEELRVLVENIITALNLAINDVDSILKNKF